MIWTESQQSGNYDTAAVEIEYYSYLVLCTFRLQLFSFHGSNTSTMSFIINEQLQLIYGFGLVIIVMKFSLLYF